jgi:HK97 family phage major capsid protein
MDINGLENLRDEQARIATQMRTLVDDATVAEDGKEARGFSAEDEQTWQNMNTRFEELDGLIAKVERSREIDTGLEAVVNDYNARINPARPESGPPAERFAPDVRGVYDATKRAHPKGIFSAPDGSHDGDDYVEAFRAGIRQNATPEQAQILQRAAQTSTTTGGGYTIPTGFRSDIEVAMAAFGGITNVATHWNTPSGNPVEWPTITDVANTGRLLTENTAETNTAVVFAQTVFNAYKYSSDYVLVPVELAMDTGIALESLLAQLLGERLGRVTSLAYATADGSSKPQGLVAAATSGVTTATKNVIVYDDVLDLIHSVDPAYRVGPGVGFVFSDTTLKTLKQIKDETNSQRPLWAPNIADAVPATIDGYSYQVDQNVPNAADNSPDGGEKIMVFGDLSKFIIRDVMGMTLRVLNELYAANHQTGYVAIMRTDSDLIQASAVRAMTNKT